MHWVHPTGYDPTPGMTAVRREASERQLQAQRDFSRWIGEGLGPVDALYCYCGADCKKSLEEDKEEEEEEVDGQEW